MAMVNLEEIDIIYFDNIWYNLLYELCDVKDRTDHVVTAVSTELATSDNLKVSLTQWILIFGERVIVHCSLLPLIPDLT